MGVDNKINISIFGSCIGRDIFEISHSRCGEDGEYKINRFIQSINPISAIAPKPNEGIINKFESLLPMSKSTNFYKRCMTLDLHKTCFDYIKEVKSDYLIIDVTPIRSCLIQLTNTFITNDLEKEVFFGGGAGFNELPSGELKDVLDIPKQEFEDLMKLYFDRLLELYPQERIIVLETKHTNIFIDGRKDVQYCKADTAMRYEIENKRIERAYCCAKKLLPCAHFIESMPLCIGNIHHKWGMAGLHYIDEIYDYMFKCVDFIVHNQDASTDVEIAALKEIQENYLQSIIDKYNNTILNKIKDINNLIKLSDGVIAGEYERSGIKLRIHEDNSFSIEGTAEEDVVFYLYSKHKNPLGGFISAEHHIGKGKYILSTDLDISLDTFYLQLVLSNDAKDRRWLWGSRAYRFELAKDYRLALVRIIVKNGYTVNQTGYVQVEKI